MCLAATKQPLAFSNPLGVPRTVPFNTPAGAFPRPGAVHPFYYTEVEIAEKRKNKEAADAARREADSELFVQVTEEQVRTILQPYAGFEMSRCPHCKKLYQYGIKLWDWDVNYPFCITCTECQTTLPNESYPEDKAVTIVGPDGKAVTNLYYEDGEGVRYFYRSKAQQIARNNIALSSILDVVEAYVHTGESKYARRIAVVLARLAEIYPTIPYHGPGRGYGETTTGYVEKFYDPNPPHEYMAGKWYNTAYVEVYYSQQQAMAYDQIYHSGELEKLSDELGYDVKQLIERDLLYLPAVTSTELTHILDNYDPSAVSGIATVGRCLNDPLLIRMSIQWMDDLLKNTVLRDGMWYEGNFGYHAMVANGIDLAADMLHGYSDPPGYVPPDGGYRLENFDPYEHFPILETFFLSPLELHWPDGTIVLFGDTRHKYGNHAKKWRHFYDRVMKAYAPRRTGETGSVEALHKDHPESVALGNITLTDKGESRDILQWLDLGAEASDLREAVGLILMRSGGPQHRAQLVLSYGATTGHHHYDKLGINFFALSDEMLSERAYTYTKLRAFATGTASHNTVVVDGQSQSYGRGGDVKCAILNLPNTAKPSPVQYCQVWMDDTYPQTAGGMYRRSVAMVNIDEKHVYLVDVFNVKGGGRHDYFLHGSCDKEMIIDTTIPLENASGTLHDLAGKHPPKDSYSSMHPIQLVARGSADSNQWQVNLNYEKGNDPAGLKVYLNTNVPTKLISGKAPTIRKAEERDEKLEESMTAALCIRSEGHQRTDFEAVMVPYEKVPVVQNATRLSTPSGSNVTAFKVATASTVDYIFIGVGENAEADITDEQEHSGKRRDFSFAGNFAFIRFVSSGKGPGRLGTLVTADTTLLKVNGKDYASGPPREGMVTKIGGDILRRTPSYFDTAAELCDGQALSDRLVVLSRPDGVSDTYVVGHVEENAGGSRVYLRKGTTIIEAENKVYEVDSANHIVETQFPFKRAICSEWEKGKRVKIGDSIFRIKDVLETSRPVTFETPARIVVDDPKGLEGIKAGDSMEIYSNIPGDRWRINNVRVEEL
jgi:hypothetical protein